MTKLKKLFLTLMFIIIGVALIGCKGKENKDISTVKTVLETTELFSYNPDDKSILEGKISKDLYLQTKIGKYPIIWESSDESVLDSEGKIINDSKEVEVTLTAVVNVEGTILKREYKFIIKENKELKCIITFHLDGGSHDNKIEYHKGDKLALSSPVKDGYSFVGWFLDKDFNKPLSNDYVIEKDIDLYAKYQKEGLTPPTTYDVEFMVDDLKYGDTQKIVEGNKAEKPEDPTKEGFSFIEWQLDGKPYDFNQPVIGSIILVAYFEKDNPYGITDIVDAKVMGMGDPTSWDAITIEGIISSSYKNNKDNYNFFIEDSSSAIVLETQVYSPSDLVTGNRYRIEGMPGKNNYNRLVFWPYNVELLEENVPLPDHNIIYDVSKETLDYDGLSRLYERFSIEGLTLGSVPDAAGKNAKVTDDNGNPINIRVHKYLETNQLNSILAQFEGAEVGSRINLKEVPLDFFQWKTDPYEIQFMITAPEQIEITSEVVEKHTVTINFENGTENQYLKVVDGGRIDESSIRFAYKEGHRFDGWYQDSQVFDFNTQIFADITLTARYTKLEDGGGSSTGDNPVVDANQKDPKVIAYYQAINFNDNAQGLLESLKALINHPIGSYAKALDILKEADRDINYPSKIRGIYNGELYAPNGGINREHVMPQSKLPNKTAQKAEVHNLRLSQVAINSTRSNHPFNEPSNLTPTTPADIIKENGTYFWPGHKDKGDVARILMFMFVRYNANLNSTIKFEMLLKWHLEDPVDAFEIQRNNVIHKHQGNRNPFIDHPEIFETILALVNSRHMASLRLNEQFRLTLDNYLDIMTVYIPEETKVYVI